MIFPDRNPIEKPIVPYGLENFIKRYSSFIIVGHKEPDGDCIGSSLAMASFLKRLGKTSLLLSAGPFKRMEIRVYEKFFLSELPQHYAEQPDTAAIVVDCSGLDRTGSVAQSIQSFPIAVIDHHATNKEKSDSSFVMPSAPSTTFLIQALIEKMAGAVSKEEAEFLFFGLSTDTGFFRHLDERSSEVFASASRLITAGANPKEVFRTINGGKALTSRILIARVLQRLKPYYNGLLMVSYETYQDSLEFGLEGRDSDAVYQLIQSIEGVEAIVIVRQESETHCSVVFRSFDKIDVSIVASSFGGGGHKQAAGLYIEGKYEELIPRFVEAFRNQIEVLS